MENTDEKTRDEIIAEIFQVRDKAYVRKLEENADAGKPETLWELARIYRYGKANTCPDGYKAIKYFEKVGDFKSIAEIYRDGKPSVTPDGKKAIEYFIKEVERDKGKTLEEIANMYIKNGRNYNIGDANEYLDNAKEICNIYVFEEIAKIFLEGRGGIQTDGQKALEYFFKAIEAVAGAVNFTKNFVQQCNEIHEKQTLILSHFLRWARKIKKEIYRQIAEVYLTGKSKVQVDGHKAIEYLEEIAELQSDLDEEYLENFNLKIAEIYLKGLGGVQVDGYKAIEYLDKVSGRNRIWALEQIAEIYGDGKAGVAPDSTKFIEYILKCIGENSGEFNSNIYNKLAWIYLEGRSGIQADGYKAIEYFDKVSGENRILALEQIAEIYRDGKAGVQIDGHKAIEYFQKLIDLQSDLVKEYLGDINFEIAKIYLEGLGGIQADGYKAIEYLDKISDEDRIWALEKIAEIYRDGKAGVEPDEQKALEFFKKSAALEKDFVKLTDTDEY